MNITEVLKDYKTIGDFSKDASFTGNGSDVDRKLAVHPTNIMKAYNFFSKRDHHFKFYVVNNSAFRSKGKVGEIDISVLENVIGDQPVIDEIKNNTDVISIVYIDNTGDDRVIFTPWIMAHRISHAIILTDVELYDVMTQFMVDMMKAIGYGYDLPDLQYASHWSRHNDFNKEISAFLMLLVNKNHQEMGRLLVHLNSFMNVSLSI